MASQKPAQIAEKSAVALVMEMMKISGKSGEEAEIVAYIKGKLRDAGVSASQMTTDSANKKSPIGGQVGNLIVKLPGTLKKAPRRLLMAHVDTVPLCVGCQPVRRGNLIASKLKTTALGGDNRAGAAVILNAVLTILKKKLPHPPLTLFFPVQEEIGLNGARYVTKSKLGKPALCFNWDGGDTSMATIGATGAYNMAIRVHGIASHAGAHPEKGASAIAIAGLALADLHTNGWHGAVTKGKKYGTSNVGFIGGGEATNVVTPFVDLKAEARSHDAKFRERIVREFKKAFEKAARSVKNAAGERGSIDFEIDLRYDSFRMSASEASVKAAFSAIKKVGLDPQTQISNGGLDANWMAAHGFKTVTLGCGQQAIHTVNETLRVDRFLEGCQLGLLLATATEAE